MPNTAFDPTYIANQRGEHLMTYEQLSKAAVLALVFLSGSAIARDWPTLDMHGNQYEAACTPGKWQELQTQIVGLAGKRKPAELTHLIRTLFCGNGHSATRSLRAHVAMKVAVVSEATGEMEADHSWETPLNYQPFDGKVWNATVGSNDQFINVSYDVNEACNESQTLRYRFFHWQIFEAGGACD